MTRFEWLSLAIAFLSVLLIPALILLVRVTRALTRSEDKLNEVIKDVGRLVADKDKVHQEMYAQMRLDRDATDRRLRWLEEHTWNTGTRGRGR